MGRQSERATAAPRWPRSTSARPVPFVGIVNRAHEKQAFHGTSCRFQAHADWAGVWHVRIREWEFLGVWQLLHPAICEGPTAGVARRRLCETGRAEHGDSPLGQWEMAGDPVFPQRHYRHTPGWAHVASASGQEAPAAWLCRLYPWAMPSRRSRGIRIWSRRQRLGPSSGVPGDPTL